MEDLYHQIQLHTRNYYVDFHAVCKLNTQTVSGGFRAGAYIVSNRVTLAQLEGLGETEIANLPIDHLAMLLEDVAAAKLVTKKADEKLSAALDKRFGDFAQKSRRVTGRDTGRVRWDDEDGWEVVADLPSIVDWSQPEMVKAVETVASWGENPEEYVSTVRKVAESKYKAWPATIRKVFEPARTVRTGKPSYELIKKDAA